MIQYKHLDEKEFKYLKALTDANLPKHTMKLVTQRSNATMSNIKRSKDYAEYRAILAEYNKPKMKKEVKEEVEPVVVTDTSTNGQFKTLTTKMDLLLHNIQHLQNITQQLQNVVVANKKFRIF